MSAESLFLKTAGALLLSSLAAVYLRRHVPEFSYVVALAAGGISLAAIITLCAPVVSFVKELSSSSGFLYAGTLFKAVCISVAAQSASGVCRDAGQSAAAYKIELAGKVAILLSALPLFEDVLSLARELMIQ